MPLSILRTIDQCSLPNSWHHPSKLLPWPFPSYEDPSLWMKNDSFPTSSLTSETTRSPQHASIINPTPSGLSLPMVYSVIPIEYTFPIMAIFDSVFCNIHTTILLQVILVRQRHYMQSACNMPGPDFRTSSKTTANRAPPVPTQNQCATDDTDSSNSFRFPRSLGIRFHWIS